MAEQALLGQPQCHLLLRYNYGCGGEIPPKRISDCRRGGVVKRRTRGRSNVFEDGILVGGRAAEKLEDEKLLRRDSWNSNARL